MSITSLVRRNRDETPAVRRSAGDLLSLHRDFNRLFDELMEDIDAFPFPRPGKGMRTFTPNVNVSESDQEVKVTAELPGMDEKDIEVSLDNNTLTIKGEKKEEHEVKAGHSYHMERSYGAFHRVIPLPAQVNPAKAKANFRKGVLAVELPKTAPGKSGGRRIEVKAE